MESTTKQGLAALAVGAGLWAAVKSWKRSRNRVSFENKTVLITGGSRGFGLVMARQLAVEGARIILCARRAEELKTAAEDLRRLSSTVDWHVCDVTDESQVETMVKRILESHPGIDVAINNAGIIQGGPRAAMTPEEYRQTIDVHLFGPVHVNNAVLPSMKSRGGGSIMNVASIGGLFNVPHLTPYCASKFALVGYSLGLRSELEQEGIRVTTVCPGVMRTGSPRNALFRGNQSAEYAWFKLASSLPLVTISAENAARQAIDALRHGDRLTVLGWPNKVIAKLNAIAPGLIDGFLAAANRVMPQEGSPLDETLPGAECESWLTKSPLTALTSRAERANNEIPGPVSVRGASS